MPPALSHTQRKALGGAMMLMASSAVGPAFLTQTALFTQHYLASFGCAILISLVLDAIIQLNLWRIITVTGLHGQQIANRVLPGSGHLISGLIVLGGIAFNIGNVAGAGLGLNVIFGMPPLLGSLISALLVIAIFIVRNAQQMMDRVVKLMTLLMLALIVYAMLRASPPLWEALMRTVAPVTPTQLFLPVITLVGGTVGGYITFSGGHRLVDSGITGERHVQHVTRVAITGIVVTGVIRVSIFLAALRVVAAGHTLSANNPAASVFEYAVGPVGYTLFGIVLFCAALTSVIGAAYTSTTFLYDLHDGIRRHSRGVVVLFILLSTALYIAIGQPVRMLVTAGALNALVLPLAVGTLLWATRNPAIMGTYRHPRGLFWAGLVATGVMLASLQPAFHTAVKGIMD